MSSKKPIWYLGYIRTGKSRVVGTDEKQFNEFIVERELMDMGIPCWVGRLIEFKRTGKNRRPEPHEMPYMLNYIFLHMTDVQFWQSRDVSLLANTMMPMGRKDVRGFYQFRSAVEAEYANASKVRDNQSLIAEYRAGQALRLVSGAFSDNLLTFKRMVERADDLYPKIQADMEMMGRVVTVELDPLDVKVAE